MAILFSGTSNELSANEKPVGYVDPVITKFATDPGVYVSDLDLSVLKATVENATGSVTMDNIFDDAAIGLDKQITDILAADYLASATVTAYAELRNLSNNFAAITGSGVYLKNTAASYLCTVKLFVKAE